MSSRARGIRDAMLHRALALTERMGPWLSVERARSIGRRCGRIAYTVLRRMRRKTFASIACAFPDMPADERKRLAVNVFEHLGTSLLETAWMVNLTPANLHETTRIDGLEHLRNAGAAGRGVMLVTGHCGNWEWMAAAIGLSGLQMNVLARELTDSTINDFIVESRRRHGVVTIGRGSSSSARDVLTTLRSGAILGVLLDQNIRAESVPVPFFGRPAPTPIGLAKLTIRAGAPIVTGFIERRDGMQHIHFDPPIETHPGDCPVELTRRLTATIEDQVRRVPEQWVWMHDRWKERKSHCRRNTDRELQATPAQP